MAKKTKADKKIEAFRTKDIKSVHYNAESTTPTITLMAGRYKVNLALDLVWLDGNIQLAFSGDIIATDGKSLSRIMKVMWNEEIPEFDLSDELREALGIKSKPVHLDDEPEPGIGVNHVNVKREPIYFKDMAPFVAGLGNDVVTTVKRTFNIDE